MLILGQQLAIDRRGLARRLLPGEAPRSLEPPGDEVLAKRTVKQCLLSPGSNRLLNWFGSVLLITTGGVG